MCGRFTVTSPEQIALAFGPLPDAWPGPRFNIAPTDPVLGIANGGARDIVLFRWGLIPHWAKGPDIGAKMINARSETVAEKPAFRDSLKRKRCVILGDGFFEWRRDGKQRVPFFIRREPHTPFAMAGLWSTWRDAKGAEVRSCSIITGDAHKLLSTIHHRMPLLITPEQMDPWLSADPLPREVAEDILSPHTDDGWVMYEVSPKVNSVANDDPSCVVPGPVQQRLFD